MVDQKSGPYFDIKFSAPHAIFWKNKPKNAFLDLFSKILKKKLLFFGLVEFLRKRAYAPSLPPGKTATDYTQHIIIGIISYKNNYNLNKRIQELLII